MSDPSPVQATNKRERGLLERISGFLFREPEDREQLSEILHQAHDKQLLDAEALAMILGVMSVSEKTAGDIMIPRTHMDLINVDDPLSKVVSFAVEKAHSRFPVYEASRDNVIGILLAKDLLQGHLNPEVHLRDLLRPAVFIPESKPLNVLLREFRLKRNHIALVVEEFGGISGLLTIEDVLEQIVGDIEDEYDLDDDGDNIVCFGGANPDLFRVKALTELEQFNSTFEANLADEHSETIGGLLSSHLGRVPRRGEVLVMGRFKFEVLRASARQVHLLKVQVSPASEGDAQQLAANADPS